LGTVKKGHQSIYQNFEYKIWKQSKSSNSPINVEFHLVPSMISSKEPSGSESRSSLDKEKPALYTLPRKQVSDTNINSLTIRKQIKNYLSCTQVSHYLQNPANPPEIRPAPGLQLMPRSQENFESYMAAYATQYQNSNPTQYAPPLYQSEQMQHQIPYYPSQPVSQMYIPVLIPNAMLNPQFGYTKQVQKEYEGCILTGKIKFFDEIQNYGFFVLDCDGTDLFVHYDDLLKSNITKDYIRLAKSYETRFMFRCISYYGKYSLSYKAVDIQIINDSS